MFTVEYLRVFFRHPSAAVDSVKSVAPPRGGGAHRSGVSGLDRALRRKRYLHLTTSVRFRLVLLSVLSSVVVFFLSTSNIHKRVYVKQKRYMKV